MNYEEIYNIIFSNPLYKAILYIILSVMVARIADLIFTSLLKDGKQDQNNNR